MVIDNSPFDRVLIVCDLCKEEITTIKAVGEKNIEIHTFYNDKYEGNKLVIVCRKCYKFIRYNED